MKIAIDIDDVIADSISAVIAYHNSTYGTTLTLHDFITTHYNQVWGGTREQAIEKVHHFYQTHFFKNLKPIPGAQRVLASLKQEHQLAIVTGRPHSLAQATHGWISEHFPQTFSEIHTANLFTADGTPAIPKSHICDTIGADVLIEDSLENAIDCVREYRKILLLQYPWNAHCTDLPDNIHAVQSWQDIIRHF